MSYRWVARRVVDVAHAQSLSRWGGMPGVRDEGAILSALARPENLAAYGKPNLADLAAAYLHGLAKAHGFLDGNKRTAWLVARLFVEHNGQSLRFDHADAVLMVVRVADGSLSEHGCATWFRERMP